MTPGKRDLPERRFKTSNMRINKRIEKNVLSDIGGKIC